MGGLARRIPVTFATFAIATAAIAGLPPLAGFFSKDEILWFALASEHGGSTILFGVACLTALLTAFYMFRLLWLTFLGAPRMDDETARHVHESPRSMTGVLVVLAVLSAVGGFVGIPHYLEPLLPLPSVKPGLEHFETGVVVTSVALALAGLVAAAYLFGGDAQRAQRIRERFAGIYRVLSNKYYVDELYDAVIGRPLLWISQRVFLDFGDRRLLDGSLDGLAALARRGAGVLGRVQAGNLQLYALLALIGLVATLAWTWRHG
jgi:NADH-quinone oxidoreductase subunit L